MARVWVGLLPRNTYQHLDTDYSHLVPYLSVLITFITKSLLPRRLILYIHLVVLKTNGVGQMTETIRNTWLVPCGDVKIVSLCLFSS